MPLYVNASSCNGLVTAGNMSIPGPVLARVMASLGHSGFIKFVAWSGIQIMIPVQKKWLPTHHYHEKQCSRYIYRYGADNMLALVMFWLNNSLTFHHVGWLSGYRQCLTSHSLYRALLPWRLLLGLLPSLIARFMGPAWGPSGADRTQVDPMLAPWTLLSGNWCPISLR